MSLCQLNTISKAIMIKREDIIRSLEEDCVQVKMKIKDVFGNPHCDLSGKVFCGNKKNDFLDDLKEYKEKYKNIAEAESTPLESLQVDAFNDAITLCKRHEDKSSDKAEIPWVLMEIVEDPEAEFEFKLDGILISTPDEYWTYAPKKIKRTKSKWGTKVETVEWFPTLRKGLDFEDVPFICNIVNGKSGGMGTGTCNIPDDELKRIYGVVSLGTSRLSLDRWALAKINRIKLRHTDLGLIPIDKDTENRWMERHTIRDKDSKEILYRDFNQKEYMNLIGIKGKSSGITFRYLPSELDRLVAMNHKEHISTFY